MKPQTKPFQSVKECPKCRALASEASYKYVDDDVWQNTLLRTCARCGFSWPENPADYPTESQDTPEEDHHEYFPPGTPWFIERMATDHWTFGLLDRSGTLYFIETILEVNEYAGQLWLDVRLSEWQIDEAHLKALGAKTLISGELAADSSAYKERSTISINASHIVAAFDMALLTGS